MLGKIISIVDNMVTVRLSIDITQQVNLINLHVVFEDKNTKIVGEIQDIQNDTMICNIVGEIENGVFMPGFSKKPSFKSKVRLITGDELVLILGKQQLEDQTQVAFGLSTVYQNYQINVNINQFFCNSR